LWDPYFLMKPYKTMMYFKKYLTAETVEHRDDYMLFISALCELCDEHLYFFFDQTGRSRLEPADSNPTRCTH